MTPVNAEVVISNPKICTSDLLQQSSYMHCSAVTQSLFLLLAILNTRFNLFSRMLITFHTQFLIFNQKKNHFDSIYILKL